MDLDNQELESTRKHNGANTKIVIPLKGVEEKLEELNKWLEVKTPEDDEYYYIKGKIDTLIALKKGDLSVL